MEAIKSRILQLPTADRVCLLDRVVASLDVDAARDAAWDTVAARRDDAAKNDPCLLVPLDDVLVHLRETLK
jgi:hypothetical protein